MTEVQAIHARFTGDTSNLDAAVRNATTRMDQFNDRVRAAAKRAADLGAAAGVATGAIAAAGSAILRTADEIGKAAQAAGVTTDQLQELRFAFGQVAGTTNRQVDQALQRFSVAIGEARQGTGEYLDTIKQLNVNLSQDTPAALEETLTALSQIEDDADRAAAASALFGTRAGPRLAGALKGGTEAVQSLRDAIQRDGGVISAENIDNAEAFNDQMDRLSKIVTADLANTMLENADAMQSLAEGMASVASAAVSGIAGLARFGSSIGTFLGERAGESYREELQEQLGTGAQPQRMRSFFRDRVASGSSAPAAMAAESGGAAAQEFFAVPQGMGGQLGIAASEEAAAALEVLREESLTRFEELQKRYMSEQELLLLSKQEELAIVQEALANRSITEEEARATTEQIEQEHMDKLAQIRERGMDQIDRITQQSFARQASFVAGQLEQMTRSTANENRAMFELNKAAALASAALDAREAITGSYKVGARIGGPKLGAAFAAAAAAAQASNIAAIASTSFGGGVAPGVGATAAPPVVDVGSGGNASGAGNNNAGSPASNQTLTVSGITADALFDGDSIRGLVQQIVEFQRDGGNVIIGDR